MKRLNLLITDEQWKALKELKRKNELTTTENIRRAIDEYLARFKEKEK